MPAIGIWGKVIALIVLLGMILAVFRFVDTHWETSAGIKHGEKNIQTKWDAANEAQRQKEAKQQADATKALEVKREKAQVVYKTITKDVEKVVERPIYREQCFDKDGLKEANLAIQGKTNASASGQVSGESGKAN